jgi:hypothetical protein
MWRWFDSTVAKSIINWILIPLPELQGVRGVSSWSTCISSNVFGDTFGRRLISFLSLVRIFEKEITNNLVLVPSLIKDQILFLLIASPDFINFSGVAGKRLLAKSKNAWEESFIGLLGQRGLRFCSSWAGASGLNHSGAGHGWDGRRVCLFTLCDENVINEIVEHLNHMVWIVVNSASIFVNSHHFLSGLSLLDALLVPWQNQESGSKKEPNTSSTLTRVEVEDHQVPDPQQSVGVEIVTVETTYRIIDEKFYRQTKLVKLLRDLGEVNL